MILRIQYTIPCFTYRVVCVNILWVGCVEIRNVHTLHYSHNWYLFILRRMVGQFYNISNRGTQALHYQTDLMSGHSGWSGGDCEEKSLEQSLLWRTRSPPQYCLNVISFYSPGKRGWTSNFHGGLGKRRWNSNFSGGNPVSLPESLRNNN